MITNGGDQPNVVPRNASIWWYFRETDQPHIQELWDIGNKMAEGAAMMTNTKMTSRILGAAYPQHMNKAVAEAMYENIKTVGLPTWSEEDQTLAKALQKELGNPRSEGLALKLGELGRAESRAREHRRRLRRHRRRVLERADRDAALSRRTFPACPGTTGRARSPAPRRSRTRAWSPARRCRR